MSTPYVFRPTTSPQEAANWSPRQILVTDLRAVRGRAYPRVTGMFREKSWVFFEILLPFLATSAFVFVYRALQAPPEYIGFVVLGGAMTAFWLNVIWMMAQQLWWEKSQGNLELYFAAPMNIMSVLFGMAVGGFVMSSTRAVTVLLGMVLASLFLMWGREAWHLTQLLIEPVYFVSGMSFPVGRLGVVGSLAISILPLAVGLDAMRQLAFAVAAYPLGTPGPQVEALILVAMTVAFLLAARWTLRVLENRARREGRLSVRWQ